MKKNYILLAGLAVSIGFFSFKKSTTVEWEKNREFMHAQSGGGQHGLTGAPGENTCAQCHGGNLMTGTTENSLSFLDLGSAQIVTEYVPGNSYLVTLNMTSNPTEKGFSATALESTATNTSPSGVCSALSSRLA